MRECSLCGADCDSSIGMYRELKSEYWGGRRNGNVEYSPKLVSFFCSDDHRNEFIDSGMVGGDIQTDKWGHDGEE